MNLDTLRQFFLSPADPSLLTFGTYDPALVGLSVLVAIFSSWMGLQIAGQARLNPAQRSIVLLTGSLALGSGVWAMHFIGMLAFGLCTRVDYDPGITLISIVPSVAASFVALSLIERPRITGWALIIGGVLVGAGIGAMHYTGMAAMRMNLVLRYDPAMFGLSIVVAVALATLALWVRFGLRSFNRKLTKARLLLISAIVMGLAISGMHYTGMAAARFVGQVPAGASASSNGTFLALAISLITVAFTIFVVAANGLLRYRQLYRDLRLSEARTRALISNIPGISYRSRMADGYPLEFISDAVERVAGYPAADFYGQPPRRTLGSLVHAADRARIAQAVSDALLAGRPYLIEYRLLHADGSTRWLWENGSGVRNDAGELAWLDGVILDISERRAMEDALRKAKEKAEQAAAARSTFVANMSHEIRTPMNSILGFTDVLLDGELAPDQRRHLDIVRSAGRSLLRLLNEILDTAKLEKGAVELEVADFNLLGLIDELSSTMGAAARNKGLHIDIDYDADLPTCLRGDELRMRQVLTNLLDNAIKFTSVGSVTLVAEANGDQLHFMVRDTGIGIAPERLAAIFDPFTQADASMTRRFGGTGLGTTISKQLVDLMGGSIWVESTLGEGTRFHVLLPLAPCQFAPQKARARVAAVLPPLRILAADDVPQNLQLLQLLLTRRGHTVTVAGGGAAAGNLAASGGFDLILMDVQMPHVDGLAATREIRAQALQAGRARVPIVAMTASVLDAHRRASADAGMDGFTSKPIDWFAVSHEIARVLGLGQGAEQGAPALSGPQVFNREAGLRRWVGRDDAYGQALAHFEAEQAALGAALRAAIAAGDVDGAHALSHKVRGLAANLGLEQLAESLAQLEIRCAAGDAPAALLARVEHDLAAALESVCAALPAAPAAAPARHGSGSALDAVRVHGAGAALMQAFGRGAMDDAALAELTLALGPDSELHAAPIHAALADFDFALARSRVDALLARLVPHTSPENTA